jgi:hypothetical protein
MLFDNDIQKASAFLTAHAVRALCLPQGFFCKASQLRRVPSIAQALAQLGFGDLRIREALLMCDNNQEKAVQYLMMNT